MQETTLEQQLGQNFAAGTVLFRQGAEGKHMYVIQSGRIAIVREMGDSEIVLAELPPGEFFGEMSILNDAPRSATVRVLEDAHLLVIDANTFGAMIRGSAEIAARLIGRLASRLADTTRQVEILAYRDPASRVVHCLRQEAAQSGSPDPSGIGVDLRDRDLAERLGLSLDEVRAVLQRLDDAHLLTRRLDGTFVVAETGKLLEFLDLLEIQQLHGVKR